MLLALTAALAATTGWAIWLKTYRHGPPRRPKAGQLETIYILAGQSNMEGWGRAEEIPARTWSRIASASLYETGYWRPAGPYVPSVRWKLWPKGRWFGPELGLLLTLAERGEDLTTVGVVKVTRSATSMAAWRVTEPAGLMGRALLDTAARIKREHPRARFAAFVWMQGESDASDKTLAQNYEQNLAALLAAVRKATGNPTLPACLGLISAKRPWTEAVRQATRDAAERDDMAKTVDISDLSTHDGGLHLNTEGQVALGRRFADASRRLNGGGL